MPSVDSIKRELRSYIEDSRQTLALLTEENQIIKADLDDKRESFRAALNPLHDNMSEEGLTRLETVIARSGLKIKAVAEVQAEKASSAASSAHMAESIDTYGSDEYLGEKIESAINSIHRLSSTIGMFASLDLKDMYLENFKRLPKNSHFFDEMIEISDAWKEDLQVLREEKLLRKQWQSTMLSDKDIDTALAHKIALAIAKNKSVKDNFEQEYGEDAKSALLALAKLVAVEQFHTQIISHETRILDGIRQLEGAVSMLDKVKGYKEYKCDIGKIERAVRDNTDKVGKYISEVELRRQRIQEYSPPAHHRSADYFNHIFLYAIAFEILTGHGEMPSPELAQKFSDTVLRDTPNFELNDYDMDTFNVSADGMERLDIDSFLNAIYENIDTKELVNVYASSYQSPSWNETPLSYDSGSNFSMD